MRHRSIPLLSLAGYLTEDPCGPSAYAVLAGVSSCYPPHRGRLPMYYSPVRHSSSEKDAFDLHVLGTPPAFILSQDQTLHYSLCEELMFSSPYKCYSNKSDVYLFSFQCSVMPSSPECLFILPPVLSFVKLFLKFFCFFLFLSLKGL